jgi:hypothetical protein
MVAPDRPEGKSIDRKKEQYGQDSSYPGNGS